MMADRLPAETPSGVAGIRRKEFTMKHHLIINGNDMGEAFPPRPNHQYGRLVWLLTAGYYISVDCLHILEKKDDFTITIYQGGESE